MYAIVVMRQQTGQRTGTTAELRIVLVIAVATLDDQLAIGEERIILAVLRNVRTLHIDLFRMERWTECILRSAFVIAAIGCGCAENQHTMRIGDLNVMTVRSQLDAVLGPGNIGRRMSDYVTRQRDVGSQGEGIAVVQNDVGGDGNWTMCAEKTFCISFGLHRRVQKYKLFR